MDKISSVANSFYEATSIKPKYDHKANLLIYKKDFDNFFGRIAKYVPDCMQYKLPPEYRGQYVDFELDSFEEIKPVATDILNITHTSKRQARNKHKYDLTIANNHTYVAGGKRNGVVVHNSNETTTGGNALKFYASQRIELKKTTAIKEGEEVVGYNTKITVKKNKIAPPMKTCTIPFMFGKGFGGSDEVLNLALDYGFIDRTGAWFTTHDNQRFQGMSKVREYYSANPTAFEELRTQVVNKLKGVEFENAIEFNEETGEIIE